MTNKSGYAKDGSKVECTFAVTAEQKIEVLTAAKYHLNEDGFVCWSLARVSYHSPELNDACNEVVTDIENQLGLRSTYEGWALTTE